MAGFDDGGLCREKNAVVRKHTVGFLLLIVSFVLLSTFSVSGGEWAEPEKVLRVLGGDLQEAKATWWGFDPVDSTKYLTAAINSGARKVVIPNMGVEWIAETIEIEKDNVEIFFEPGTVVLAKEGAFKGAGDGLFRIRNRENIVLRGEGATLRMRRDDYSLPPYRRGQWRSLVIIRASRNVKVSGLTLESSGGDGIYISIDWPNWDTYCENVIIRNVNVVGNYRQGISIESVEGLLIEDTVFRDTAGTPPMAGICIEPYRAEMRIKDLVFRNVVTENNAASGFFIYLTQLTAVSKPISIRFEDCVSVNDFDGIRIRMLREGTVRGLIEFVGTSVNNPRNNALIVEDKWEGVDLRFKDTVFRGSRLTPFKFDNIQNVEFIDCVVEDWKRRPFVEMGNLDNISSLKGKLMLKSPYPDVSLSKKLGASLLTLGLDVHAEASAVAPPDVIHFDIPQLRPLSPRKLVKRPMPLKISHSASYAVYAELGERVELKIEAGNVRKIVDVDIVCPEGVLVKRFVLEPDESKKIAFNALSDGIYAIGCASPMPGNTTLVHTNNRMSVLAHSVRQPRVGDRLAVSSSGELYFWVPAGAEKCYVKVLGFENRRVNAGLYNAEGVLVDSKKNIPYQTGDAQGDWDAFIIKRDDPSRGEIWSIRLEGFAVLREDQDIGALIKLYDPIPPVVSFHPDALLVPATGK